MEKSLFRSSDRALVCKNVHNIQAFHIYLERFILKIICNGLIWRMYCSMMAQRPKREQLEVPERSVRIFDILLKILKSTSETA